MPVDAYDAYDDIQTLQGFFGYADIGAAKFHCALRKIGDTPNRTAQSGEESDEGRWARFPWSPGAQYTYVLNQGTTAPVAYPPGLRWADKDEEAKRD